MNWLAVLLTLGYAGQAGLLVVLGTDATPVLRAFAIGNALIAATALWIWHFVLSSRGPRAARGSLLVVGVALLVPAFFLPSLAQYYEVARLGMRVGQTHLDDVTDEPLYSNAGNLMGMRIGFTLVPPETGYYSVDPLIEPAVEQESALAEALAATGLDRHLFDLRVVRRTIDPEPRAINVRRLAEDVLDRTGGGLYLEQGVAYGFTYDLLPAYMIDPRDPLPARNAGRLADYCLALPDPTTQQAPTTLLASLDQPRPYRMAVNQTTFGWDDDGAVSAATGEAYAPGAFYHGVIAEGVPACASGN